MFGSGARLICWGLQNVEAEIFRCSVGIPPAARWASCPRPCGSGTLPPPAAGQPSHTAGTLADTERQRILQVLEETNWVLSGPHGAAAKLGLKRPTLQFRMKKLGIIRPQ